MIKRAELRKAVAAGHMTKELQSHIFELEKLKGIRIATGDNQQPFLVFTYREKRTPPGDRVFVWGFWAAIVAIYGACAFLIWWLLQ
jgi:hypothetical protein